MEENLDKNNKVNKEISDNTTKPNSEEIKVPKSEKVINMDINNGDSAAKVVIKNENNTSENLEDDLVSNNNYEEMEPNVEIPPQRDIRETQPTISVNYRVVKNMNDNNFKKDQSYSNQDIKDDWDSADNDW